MDKLTDDERLVMLKSLLASSKKVSKTPDQIFAFASEIYLAGMNAGIELAAKAIEGGVTVVANFEKDTATAKQFTDFLNHPNVCGQFALAIRRLLK